MIDKDEITFKDIKDVILISQSYKENLIENKLHIEIKNNYKKGDIK